jgi:hypothetical protein
MHRFSAIRNSRTAAFTACLCFVLIGLADALRAGPANAETPSPAISLPPNGTHGFPFSATAIDLSKFGYMEQEFFIGGQARSYLSNGPLGPDGEWNASPAPDTAPYTTRVLIRRPIDPHRFNGTVYVEWLNVTGGADGTPDWDQGHVELLRDGYVWVGVSAQFVGDAFLQIWETGPDARYAKIFHPGDSFSYDIYSQAGVALRRPAAGGPAPLGNLTDHVQNVIAVGDSQSAFFLFTYYNAIQPTAQVYDGVLIHSAGSGSPLSQSVATSFDPAIPTPPGVPATPNIPVPTVANIRTDLNQPVLFLNTETDQTVLGAGVSVHLQPDSKHFRMWEMAGTSHADQYLLNFTLADAAKSDFPFTLDCGIPPINQGPATYGERAAMRWLDLWVRFRIAPPIAPRLSVALPAPPGLPSLNRDSATGLAIGGIRYPQIAVPISTETGDRPLGALAANPLCVLFGAHSPWDGDTDPWDGLPGFDPAPYPAPILSVLYPSHQNYVRRVEKSAIDSVLAGVLLPEDLGEILEQAEAAPVP